MTLDKFFEELAKLKDKPWYNSDHCNSIRYDFREGCMCPITAVCMEVTGIYYPPEDYNNAARRLNLNANLMLTIIDAADYTNDKEEVTSARKRILQVLEINQ